MALQLAGIIRDVDFAPEPRARSRNGALQPLTTRSIDARSIDERGVSGKTRRSAGVAQLVEHPICNRAVGGSSPSTSTIFPVTSCADRLKCGPIAGLHARGSCAQPAPLKMQTGSMVTACEAAVNRHDRPCATSGNKTVGQPLGPCFSVDRMKGVIARPRRRKRDR